jgi:cation diffusion facilitator CzcD-associated flavoprotein CzcO
VRLAEGARIAVIGAGPSGIAAARHALDAGFEVSVFEASDRLGGQWYTAAAHSGVWPGMHTNTSRAMTAFSDLPALPGHPLHPTAEQIHAYLEEYARTFGVFDRIRLECRVERVRPGWTVDGEPFDAVVVASGRFRTPRLPAIVQDFGGQLFHSCDYPGASAFAGLSVLVYGNGISGAEIASDLAAHAPVISAFRKSRYVIQKVVGGVSSDWQWYTLFGAQERRLLTSEEWSRRQRDRVLRVAGDPADFGVPAPDEDLRIAGLSLCQDYLAQVREGSIVCRPAIAAVDGRTVTFTDGTSETVDVIVCATGYDLDIPYLDSDLIDARAGDWPLYQRTFHPDLPGLGVIGQFLAQGPYFPLLELQARWIVAVWSGAVAPPGEERMRQGLSRGRPAVEAHNALALTLSEESGVSPDPLDWPQLAEPLIFGPMLPMRYRLSGPGALPRAAAMFASALATSPRAPVAPGEIDALRGFGWEAVAGAIRPQHDSRTASG